MPSHRDFPPEVQQSGAAILAFVAELTDLQGVGLRVLARHGIVNPEAAKWYPFQGFIRSVREIASVSGPATLKAIGKRIPGAGHWPPGVDSLGRAIGSLDVAYHLNVRGGEVGQYRGSMTGEHSAQVSCDNPFPCAFDLGILEGVLEKFLPPGSRPLVTHADPKTCRELDGASCTYLLTW